MADGRSAHVGQHRHDAPRAAISTRIAGASCTASRSTAKSRSLPRHRRYQRMPRAIGGERFLDEQQSATARHSRQNSRASRRHERRVSSRFFWQGIQMKARPSPYFSNSILKVPPRSLGGAGLVGIVAAVGALSRTASRPGRRQRRAQRGLEEIIVTAQRREESLQDVPIAVAAVTAESLEITASTRLGICRKWSRACNSPAPVRAG